MIAATNDDRKWDIVSVVQPNIKMIKKQRGPLGMPFMVVYYVLGCAEVDDNNVLAVSGNWENAISSPRWDVQPGDIYGDGPGAMPCLHSSPCRCWSAARADYRQAGNAAVAKPRRPWTRASSAICRARYRTTRQTRLALARPGRSRRSTRSSRTV